MIDSTTKSSNTSRLDFVRRYITHRREDHLLERLISVKREINLERLEKATERFRLCVARGEER